MIDRNGKFRLAALLPALAWASLLSVAAADAPNVLILTVDTLRTDRLSVHGYGRETSPNIDALLTAGARFDQARTVEPLTAPALASMLTSRYPHEHGATRNGLRARPGIASLPKALKADGYRTAAFVSNWTLRDKLCGLAEHFENYDEVLTRRRWFGLVRSEATAWDVNAEATQWVEEHLAEHPDRPFLAWVHYSEPHAPYLFHREYAEQLGIGKNPDASDRYDTEIALVDDAIGRLLTRLSESSDPGRTIVVFAADHGESLGEHDYWGHGRNLFEPTLRVPMAIVWPGKITPRVIDSPALLIDIAPTLTGLLGRPSPDGSAGFDWAPVFAGADPPAMRLTQYEAHKGAVISKHESDLARRSGLLSVGMIRENEKEIFRVDKNRSRLFLLDGDPGELNDLAEPKQEPSESLLGWMRTVYDGLTAFEESPPEPLDAESIEKLRSLGYVD